MQHDGGVTKLTILEETTARGSVTVWELGAQEQDTVYDEWVIGMVRVNPNNVS